jgi:cysteine synthase A
MLRATQAAGELHPDSVVIEPTSGNTGIGLAAMCAAMGHRCILVMPDDMTLERVTLLKRLGAEVVITPAKRGMQGAVDEADALAQKTPHAVMPRQFHNVENPNAHYQRTAHEILRATDGQLDALVAGVGTGGTITGTARAMRETGRPIRIVAVEPEASQVLSGKPPGRHRIQGIGPGFTPPLFDRTLCDEIRAVSDQDAFDCMNELSRREGILAGISSGAALHVGLTVAAELGSGNRVVVILPDTGERYLSIQTYFEL